MRVGKLFAARVLRAAQEGRISFTEAHKLTGMQDGSFQKYAKFLDRTIHDGSRHRT